MNKYEVIEKIEKLSIKPGDILVLRGCIEPSDDITFLRRAFTRAGIDYPVPVIVLNKGFEIELMDEEDMRKHGWQRI